MSNFGIQVKSVVAPSFPIPVGKGGAFFFSFFVSRSGYLAPRLKAIPTLLACPECAIRS